VRLGHETFRGVRRHRGDRRRGQDGGEPGAGHVRAGGWRRRPPPPPAHRVAHPAADLPRPHPGQPAQVPARTPRARRHRAPASVTGTPPAAPARTARVAAVVATSDSSGTGIAPPVRTALTNAASCAAWPLSRALGSRELTHRWRPSYTEARTKSSRRSARPSATRSRVSFGKPDGPLVT